MNQKTLDRAERVFGTPVERHEKGSAMTLIREESDATREKSAKLKAMRLAREADAPEEPTAPTRAAPKKKVKRGRT
ncbi:hypothetical protein [Jiella mangrovi]|uniref:Transcriptional regulator n=1 Tax=Jiella mangrovi TaxID=2821407 RepID=A0ABS4BMC9_9HYPH|nr:hypothetical protein [Jiella mangrovi]MBP0617864.1 hypothetical protein [Jiella mangrovi]